MSGPETTLERARQRMVAEQLASRDVDDDAVLAALGKVPRHRFIADALRDQAYEDHPLPIGHGQTISQPYIVALTCQLARVEAGCRVLEIGTGSGYQAAVLAELAAHVISLERIAALADSARDILSELGYDVAVHCSDGYRGWAPAAPFDVIVSAAAAAEVPAALLEQLAPGGRLVLPLGRWSQELVRVTKDSGGRVVRERVAQVRFVPMVHGVEPLD